MKILEEKAKQMTEEVKSLKPINTKAYNLSVDREILDFRRFESRSHL